LLRNRPIADSGCRRLLGFLSRRPPIAIGEEVGQRSLSAPGGSWLLLDEGCEGWATNKHL
jgi:hypothetical protein